MTSPDVPTGPTRQAFLPPRSDLLDWQAAGEVRFEEEINSLAGEDFEKPSALEGWSRKHVLAHMARNADGLVNLLTWARTGIETPMYPDDRARQNGIEKGAQEPVDFLLADVRAARSRYQEAIDAMPVQAWESRVRTAQGRLVPAETVLWMRTREVWVHAVDLRVDMAFSDLPQSVAVALLDDASSALRARDGGVPVVLVADDDGHVWELHDGNDGIEVRGSVSALAGYLLRGDRAHGLWVDEGGVVPPMPRWL